MGQDQVCPACMFPFRLESEAGQGLPVLMMLDVQSNDGLLLGRMNRMEIRERIYSGRLSGAERVRVPGQEWEPIGTRPEFAQILGLVGVDVAGLAVARQLIKGWKKDLSAGGDKAAPRPQVLPRTTRAADKPVFPRLTKALESRPGKLAAVLGVLGLIWLIDFFATGF
jgi:hypothetical protein